jgi:hypothetical protein
LIPGLETPDSGWIDRLMIELAGWAAQLAKTAVDALLLDFGQATEPDFASIVPVYDRVLGIALLLVGAVIAFGLIERILGGAHGLGLSAVARTAVAVFFACSGLEVMQYLAHYAALLATTWSPDFLGISHQLQGYRPQVHLDAQGHYPAGSVFGLFLTALFMVLMALAIMLELLVRGALVLLVTAFIPLVAVLGIWPRFAAAGAHLAEFLVGLLLSKFVIATAVFIGFGMILPPLLSNQSGDWLLTGVAILFIAAFSPLVLIGALRFAHPVAATTTRSWLSTAGSVLPTAGVSRVARRATSSARGSIGRRFGSRKSQS